jgi:hypothetical protein
VATPGRPRDARLDGRGRFGRLRVVEAEPRRPAPAAVLESKIDPDQLRRKGAKGKYEDVSIRERKRLLNDAAKKVSGGE